MKKIMKLNRPGTPIVGPKKRGFMQEALDLATQSPIAAKLMDKAAKQGEK